MQHELKTGLVATLTRITQRVLLRSASSLVLAVLVGVSAFSPQALANPLDGQVVAGDVSIQATSATKLDVFQHSQKAVVEWGSFDIEEGEHTEFHQPGKNAVALNRILSQDGSRIMGRLTANGKIILVNSNGVYFGANSVVNAHGLVVSTHDIDNNDFLAGHYIFDKSGNPDASITLDGQITAQDAGIAAFVAPAVANSGVITAKLGKVQMASASKFVLDFYGDELLSFPVGSEVTQVAKGKNGQKVDALVKSDGDIYAEGGTVTLSAQAARGLIDNVIDVSGVIEAKGATVRGGKIILHGGKNGAVQVRQGAKMDASGTGDAAAGGDIDIYGENVAMLGSLAADGAGNGDGGKVLVIGENVTIFRGDISARGGWLTGNGGFVETSGYNNMSITGGTVDTTAANGAVGTWLLDPLDVRIQGGTGDGSDTGSENALLRTNGTVNFATTPTGTFTIRESEIEGQDSNIIIQGRRSVLALAGGDNIVTLKPGRSLTIETRNDAGETITSGASIDLTNLNFVVSGGGTINITASTGTGVGDIYLGGLTSDSGLISINTDNGLIAGNTGGITTGSGGLIASSSSYSQFFASGGINTVGGNVTLSGSSVSLNNVNTAGGAVDITGTAVVSINVSINAGAGAVDVEGLNSVISSTIVGRSIKLTTATGALIANNLTSTGAGSLGFIDLDAGGDITLRGMISAGSGNVDVKTSGGNLILDTQNGANGTISTASGAITLEARDNVTLLGAISSGSGDVAVRANDDITLSSDLVLNNVSGDGGNIFMQAGRSIALNNSITSDNGDVTLVANAKASAGIVNAFRTAGNAVIAMASGTSVNAGTGDVRFTIDTGAGNTNTGTGDMTLRGLSGAQMIFEHLGSAGNIIAHSKITSAVNFSAATPNGDFVNTYGASDLFNNVTGRFLVYTPLSTDITANGLTADRWYNTAYNAADPFAAAIGAGNRFVHTLAPVLTVTAQQDATRVYGDANPAFTYAITGLVNGDTEGNAVSGAAALTTTATTASAVDDDYVITAALGTLASAYNYGFTFVTGLLEVTKAALTVTADNATREYGLANPALTGGITGFLNGDTATAVSGLSYGTAATAASGIGNYAISGSGASATNYTFNYVNGTLSVTPALLTVTAADKTREYGLANPALTGAVTGFRNSETVAVVSGLGYGTSATAGSGIGGYAISGSGASAANYTFNYVDGTLSVTPALLTVTAADKTREYGLANPALTGAVTGFRNSETVAVVSGLGYGTSATAGSGIGNYAISGSGATASNYTFNYVDGALSVTPALLTVTAADKTREYGLANPALTGAVTGFRNSETVAVVSGLGYGTSATAGSGIGGYAISGSGASAANYTFNYVDGTLSVTPALLTVTAADKTREYGLANPALTGAVTGFRNSETVAVVSGLGYGTAATTASGIGGYAISGSGATASNYTFNYVDGTLSVTPALLTVTAADKTREYGLANPALTGAVTGFRNSETVAVVSGLGYGTSATAGSDIGGYAISGSGASAANYTFNYVDGTLSVTPALLTVTAADKTREYGLANPALTGAVTGFRNSETVAVVSGLGYGTAATTASGIGGYAISGSGATASNYTFNYVDGTLSVTPALLTVTAADKTREYGLANPALTGAVTGFRNSETVAVVSGLGYGTSATAGSGIGGYAISGSGATAANYTFNYVDGTLSVTPALLTVTAADKTREYGLANPALTGAVTGFRNSETVAVVSGLGYGTSATAGSGIGNYAISGSGATASNYTFNYVDGALSVTPALLTVTAADKTREYGLANPALTGAVTGFRNSETVAVVSGLGYGTAATTASGIGGYAISGSGATASNYTFNYVDGTLSVTPALLTVTAADKTREYGLANPALTGAVTGFRNSETVAVVSGLGYGTSATAGSGIGGYAISGSGATASNYTFNYVDGTLSVTPALLIVTAADKTREYGLANPALTGAVTGFRNSETVAVVSGLGYGTAATVASDIGGYAISGTGASASNYTFSYVGGTLSVTPALLTVVADDAARVYGDANPGFTGTVTGIRNGDAITGNYTTLAGLASDIGDYDITAGAAGAKIGNYTVAGTDATLTVTQAALTVAADDATRAVGDANPAFTSTITGIRNGDAITGAHTTLADLLSPVGDYAITAGAAGAKIGNYIVTLVDGLLTVTQEAQDDDVSPTIANANLPEPGAFFFSPADNTLDLSFSFDGVQSIEEDEDEDQAENLNAFSPASGASSDTDCAAAENAGKEECIQL